PRALERARDRERRQGRGEGRPRPRARRDPRRARADAMKTSRTAKRRSPAPPAPLLCRWDLDKTYLRSEFDTLRQLWRTARERGADKAEVPGVPEVLKALGAAADRRGRSLALYFVSASPPQIGKAIRDKLALDGVPYDGIVFKNQLDHLR